MKLIKRIAASLVCSSIIWVSPGIEAFAAEGRVIEIQLTSQLRVPAAGLAPRALPSGADRLNVTGLLNVPSAGVLSAPLSISNPAGAAVQPAAAELQLPGREIQFAGPSAVPAVLNHAATTGTGRAIDPVSAVLPQAVSLEKGIQAGPGAERVADVKKVDSDFAGLKAEFGEKKAAELGSGSAQTPVAGSDTSTPSPALEKPATPSEQKPAADVPAAKPGLTTVFHEPERNKSFWRYVLGEAFFLVGFEMYMVGLPFLISSLTKNSLREHNDQRAQNAAAVTELVKQNRTIARIAHWAAQGLSYVTLPFFAKKAEEGPKKWLTRGMLLRAGALALVPVVFLTTGLVSMPVSMGLLALLFAAQSYFQGITVMMEGKGLARVMGDASVTPAERTRANAILSFLAGAIAIIAPAIAGHISLIHDFFGKSGVGGAVIYGIYAGAAAVAGLIWASVRMFGGRKEEGAAPATGPPAAKKGLKGTLKELGGSLWEGTKLLWKNKFLRVMVLLSLVNSLFSDPLIFNVLPDYAEKIIQTHPAASHLLTVPVLGWFIKGLTSTPMGYFSFMVVLSSIGSIVAAALIGPARKLLAKLGYHGEEGMLKPFYILAALEAPLFFVMMAWPSLAGVLLLYGLQALVTGFGALTASGLMQKALGTYNDRDVNKVMAAESFVGIIASILSTIAYGFLLGGITTKTAMLIAAVAIAVQAVIRLASPWLAFTKAERSRKPSEPAKDQPKGS